MLSVFSSRYTLAQALWLRNLRIPRFSDQRNVRSPSWHLDLASLLKASRSWARSCRRPLRIARLWPHLERMEQLDCWVQTPMSRSLMQLALCVRSHFAVQGGRQAAAEGHEVARADMEGRAADNDALAVSCQLRLPEAMALELNWIWNAWGPKWVLCASSSGQRVAALWLECCRSWADLSR